MLLVALIRPAIVIAVLSYSLCHSMDQLGVSNALWITTSNACLLSLRHPEVLKEVPGDI